jgi:hypothetical protein
MSALAGIASALNKGFPPDFSLPALASLRNAASAQRLKIDCPLGCRTPRLHLLRTKGSTEKYLAVKCCGTCNGAYAGLSRFADLPVYKELFKLCSGAEFCKACSKGQAKRQ